MVKAALPGTVFTFWSGPPRKTPPTLMVGCRLRPSGPSQPREGLPSRRLIERRSWTIPAIFSKALTPRSGLEA